MGTTRLIAQFRVKVSGVFTLTDVDSAVFADQEVPATYGVRRTDTLASVVAAETALTRLSVGTYYKDITDPAPDLTYQWAVRWVRAGKPNAYGYFTTSGSTSSVPVSDLFTWQQFVNEYGLSNIIKASNKDSTQNTGSGTSAIPSGQPNWYAVQNAFNYATDEINGNLRGGVLQVPLDFTPNTDVVPARIAELAMTLAWSKIYGARGWMDNPKNKIGDRFRADRDAVYVTLSMYKAGSLQLPEAIQADGADAVATAVTQMDVYRSNGVWRYVDGQFSYVWG